MLLKTYFKILEETHQDGPPQPEMARVFKGIIDRDESGIIPLESPITLTSILKEGFLATLARIHIHEFSEEEDAPQIEVARDAYRGALGGKEQS